MDDEKRKQLRDAFGAFMTGVTVVTTFDPLDQPQGFTANSFSSVSLDPPLLLVSIDKRSANFDNFVQSSYFAINILAEQQKDVSDIFARKMSDRFSRVAWHTGTAGTPLLGGSAAWFECAMHQVVDAGDHAILIGEVKQFAANAQPGLGYYRGGYFTPYQNAESLIDAQDIVSTLIEAEGKVLVVKTQQGYRLPVRQIKKSSASECPGIIVSELTTEASPGFIYSLWQNRQHKQRHVVFLCNLPTTAALSAVQGGEWVDLQQLTGLSFADAALKPLLTRFVTEYRSGNYNLYYGDDTRGTVHPLANSVHREVV